MRDRAGLRLSNPCLLEDVETEIKTGQDGKLGKFAVTVNLDGWEEFSV